MMSNRERLVYMANQIARNLGAQGDDRAVAATADHLASFWERDMKAAIFECLDDPQSGLSSVAHDAVASLRERTGG